MSFISTAKYEFKHQGHCASGWDGSNTIKNNVDDCFNECTNRPNVGYFAFSSQKRGCACYFTADGCPDDEKNHDYNAYRIIKSNRPII